MASVDGIATGFNQYTDGRRSAAAERVPQNQLRVPKNILSRQQSAFQ